MNKSGLAMLKMLACITAVSFFTFYQSYDSYHYDSGLALNVLSFVSTIATPLYFLLSGYMDAGEQHTPAWQLGKIRRILLIFLFWFSFFWFAGLHKKGYLIQPWFVIALIAIYVSHPLIDRLIRTPGKMALGILLLLIFAFVYDLLASLYPNQRAFSLLPQYRIWFTVAAIPYLDLGALLPVGPADGCAAGDPPVDVASNDQKQPAFAACGLAVYLAV